MILQTPLHPLLRARVTVLRWLNDSTDSLAPIIARAREFQADALDDDIQDITNRMLAGEVGHQEARTAIWAIQWRAAKLKPKKYGERLDLGNAGGTPFKIELVKEFVER